MVDSPPWRALLDQGLPNRLRVPEPVDYVERLAALGCTVDGWETTYLHVLAGEDAVLEWMKGTGLRPVLEALPGAAREEFIQTYAVRLRRAYPAREWGTLLSFRRIFAVAQAP
jgi:trans-aconitate 2-methyltransferase